MSTGSDPGRVAARFEQVSGDRGVEALRSATTEVLSLLPYLRTEVDVDACVLEESALPSDGNKISCASLIADDRLLEMVIRDSGRRLGTDDPVVAASLFVQNYAYRIITPAVACLVTSGIVPDASAASTTITMNGGRPSTVGYLRSWVTMLTPREVSPATALADPRLLAEAIAKIVDGAYRDNVAPIVEVARRHIRVGKRLLLGNVAASSAVAFRTMEGCLGPWVQDLGNAFFDSCPIELRGLGTFLSIERGTRRGWYWERTNCCLYDRLPDKRRCADCSRTKPDERRRAYWDSLE